MKQNIYYKGMIYIDAEPLKMEETDPDYWELVKNFHDKCESYPYTGTNLKDGQVVVEGKDYELQYEHYTGFPPYTQWEKCSKEDYRIYDKSDRRIVAIPTQPKEQTALEAANRLLACGMEKYFNKEETTTEKEEFFMPPDGEGDWEVGAQSFTRQQVYSLLWTQRAMISNDLKRHCGKELTEDMFEIIENPRTPKF